MAESGTMAEAVTGASRPAAGPENDLGFGAVVARTSRRRFLNRDGSFNVRREGLSLWESLSLYHALLTMRWPALLGLLAAAYLAVNATFALAYVLCGAGALASAHGPLPAAFSTGFFFSVHTLATIGYGAISPESLAANLLVTLESLVGLLGFAVVTGIVFARFSRPRAEVIFSERAVIAPYRGITGFMFRLANRRRSQLVEVRATVILSRWRGDRGAGREFLTLRLERDRVAFFPLTWTVVHPIDESSPLWGATAADLARGEAEFLVLLSAFDETSSQNVHARSSYRWDEVVTGARFAGIYRPPDASGDVRVDIRALHDVESEPR